MQLISSNGYAMIAQGCFNHVVDSFGGENIYFSSNLMQKLNDYFLIAMAFTQVPVFVIKGMACFTKQIA